MPSSWPPLPIFGTNDSLEKRQISASNPWGLAAQFAETASNGSLEAVEVEVDPVVSEPMVEEVWLGEQGSPTKSGGQWCGSQEETWFLCGLLGVFFRGLVGFGKEQVIRCSFFVRGGDVCGAVVWQPSDWMENHVQAVLHTKLCQKMHLKTPVSSSSLRWPWNSHLLFTICRCISSPCGGDFGTLRLPDMPSTQVKLEVDTELTRSQDGCCGVRGCLIPVSRYWSNISQWDM